MTTFKDHILAEDLTQVVFYSKEIGGVYNTGEGKNSMNQTHKTTFYLYPGGKGRKRITCEECWPLVRQWNADFSVRGFQLKTWPN